MRKKLLYTIVLIIPIFIYCACSAQSFKQNQLKYSRVRQAYENKQTQLEQLLRTKKLSFDSLELFIRAFKSEQIIEVWGKNKDDPAFVILRQYRFCATSGTLGPKRKEGDLQIPEGFYYINSFNAWSSFHLSLKINYPNKSDRYFADKKSPGGDIYIHGACCTIGCIPITDVKIEELYILCVEAKNSGQKQIPVHIFPIEFTENKWLELQENHSDSPSIIKFWKNLKQAYDSFINHRIPPSVRVNAKGVYLFSEY
jgi:murein L,D-transpeptidase YafK